jgi:hypothetical protein
MTRGVVASVGSESPDFMMLLISLFIALPEAGTTHKPVLHEMKYAGGGVAVWTAHEHS